MAKSNAIATALACIIAVISITVCLAADTFPTSSRCEEALKQLITITALLVSLIYALIIPRMMADQETRNQELSSHQERLKSVFALKGLAGAVLNKANFYRTYMKWPETSYLGGIPHARLLDFESDSELTDKENEIKSKLFIDYPDVDRRYFIYFLKALEDFGLVGSFQEDSGGAVFDATQTYMVDELELRQLMITIQNIWLAPMKMRSERDYLSDSWAHSIGESDGLYWLFIYKVNELLPFIKYHKEHNSNKLNMRNFISKVFEKYVWEIQALYKNLMHLVDDYSPKKYSSLFRASCIAFGFGVVIPLIILSTAVSKDIITYLMTLLCITFTMRQLIVFIIEVYGVFNIDDMGRYRKNIEKISLGNHYEELKRKSVNDI